jgi:hypothetical protein
MEISSAVLTAVFFFGDDLRLQGNAFFSLMFAVGATLVFSIPTFELAGKMRRFLLWPEWSRIPIVLMMWIFLWGFGFLIFQPDSMRDTLQAGFQFWLCSLAYGIPSVVINSRYPLTAPHPEPECRQERPQ